MKDLAFLSDIIYIIFAIFNLRYYNLDNKKTRVGKFFAGAANVFCYLLAGQAIFYPMLHGKVAEMHFL